MQLLCATLLIFAAYCSLTDANNNAKHEDSSHGIVNGDNVKHHLKESMTATTSAVGEERAFDTLKAHTQRISQKIKAVIEKHPAYIKAKAMVDKDIRLKGALLIGRSQIKAVVIVSVCALVGGFIMHLIKD